MATSFDKIYKKFLGMITEPDYAKVSQEDLREVLFDFLDTSRSLYFTQCKKDLESITELNGEGEFHEDLTSQEQHILALGMKKAWISTKLNDADLMSKDIGDRDYKAVQGTGYLKELSKLDAQYEDEVHNYGVSYTWKNLNLEDW